MEYAARLVEDQRRANLAGPKRGKRPVFLTKLAFKNLVRHRTRTLAVGLIIAFAVFFYIMFDSLMAGMNRDVL